MAVNSYAQSVANASSPFSMVSPGRLNLTLFGGGYISDQYGTSQEGFQLEQTMISSVDLVGRAIGYQLYIGNPFGNPLAQNGRHESRLNFGRFEGGIDIQPFEGTSVYLLGGGDVGDSYAGVFEADLSSWLLLRSRHPLNLTTSTVYGSENHVTINEIDLRPMLLSNERYLVMAGAGGAIYAGGFVRGLEGQGGPDLGIYFPHLRAGINLQAGYGSARQFGQLSIFKQFEWFE
jgi:hypothetical protein